DLPHERAAVAVVLGEAALSRPLRAAGERGSPVERLDRGGAQRAVAHAGDVDGRRHAGRTSALARTAEHLGAGERGVRRTAVAAGGRLLEWERRLLDDQVAR